MHIILGASGHVGSAVVKKLVEKGEDVLGVTHSPSHVQELTRAGAYAEQVDLKNVTQLEKVFSRGKTLFILNPPGDVSQDSAALETESVRCL